MKKSIVVLLSFVISFNIYAATVEFRSEFCKQEEAGELKIKMEDMGWAQTPAVMSDKFNTIYDAGKRLEYRAYKTEKGFSLPIKGSKAVVNIGEQFIASVVSHIESALERGYVDYIFFSDMGHSHMYIDVDTYFEKINPIDNSDVKSKYEIMLNHPQTKFLYHTAEQLAMQDKNKNLIKDRKIQWRFFTRNIIGDNLSSGKLEVIHAIDSQYNTLGGLDYDKNEEKYKYWGAGYSISASKDGCFAYKNKGNTFYFDISLYDVAYGSSSFID